MSTTFKAAYLADDGSSTSGGFLLTSQEQAHLSDSELLMEAMKEAEAIGLDVSESDITIGDWTE